MLSQVLFILYISSVLLFGVFVSAAFCGVIFSKKNFLIISAFFVILEAVQLLILCSPYGNIVEYAYPFLMHLPLVLLLVLYYKRSVLESLCAVAAAYLCCSLSEWAGILAKTFLPGDYSYYIVRFIVSVSTMVILIKFAASDISTILSKDKITLFIFSILPFVYYVFDYLSTVYTNLLYSGNELVYEFLPCIMCVSYLFFCVSYFREYEEKNDTLRQNQMLKLQSDEVSAKIAVIQTKEAEISRLRHDMRHYLAEITLLAKEKNYEKIVEFVEEIDSNIVGTITHKFCLNEVTNMALSYYSELMTQKDIEHSFTVDIPKELPFSDMDFSSIIANALENSCNAASSCQDGNRKVYLSLKTNDNNMVLLEIENSFSKVPKMVDGYPVSMRKGHGIGVSSIVSTVDKLGGTCKYLVQDDMVILRIILWI